MADYCICCGRDLPSEYDKHYCRTCEIVEEHKFINFTCPECGHNLKIYHHQILDYIAPIPVDWTYTRIGLIYHCKHCGCDWDSEYINEFGDVSQSALKRHYWG